jgi:tetratricopeptide (TPR) repeat protein
MTDVAEQIAQIRLDLEDLEDQVAAGEIDEETAARLRDLYRAELDGLSTASTTAAPPPTTRSRPRLVVGALILVIGFAVTIAVLGATADDPSGALQGIASGGEFNPEDYSDETMEAVIAANADDPQVSAQIPFMRFALAERYFERGEFQRAFAHYETILAGDPTAELFTSTMTRIAWITFVGNGEVDLALQVIDRAIEATPGSTEAIYVKGQILWCGAGNGPAASELFAQVLASDELDGGIRSQVEADFDLASNGEPCV